MEKLILSKCGYRCDLCLAFKENIEKEDKRQYLSDGWYKIYRFRIPPEEIYCDGCLTTNSSDDIKITDINCKVRPCVLKKGIKNCGYCDAYICNKLKSKIVEKDKFVEKRKIQITEDEYLNLIRPYENKKRLDEIKEELKSQ